MGGDLLALLQLVICKLLKSTPPAWAGTVWSRRRRHAQRKA